MVQVFIDNKEVEIPSNLIDQIGINYQNFSIGDFADKFNSFSGNLTFPNTSNNRLIFGFATDNLNVGAVDREFTGRITYGAVEIFYGQVRFERYNNGFECRFYTTGQVLSQKLQALQMWDVLDSLPATTDWFNHKFELPNFPTYGVGRFTGKTNVVYPNIDLGYFNRNDGKLGYWDYRPTFSLYTLLDAIAYKLGYTFNFDGAVPQTLKDCYIASNNFEYSKRLIEKDALKLGTTGVTQSFTNLPKTAIYDNAAGYLNYNLTNLQLGIFTNTVTNAGTLNGTTGKEYNLRSDYTFFLKKKFTFLVTIKASLVVYNGDVTRNGIGLRIADANNVFSQTVNPTVTLLPNWVAGASSGNPAGVQPDAYYFAGSNNIIVNAFANQPSYGYQGGSDIYLQFAVSYETDGLYDEFDSQLITDKVLYTGLIIPLVTGQTNWSLDVTVSKYGNEDVLTLTHDQYIYPNGLISATDLLGSLKPADVLKYAMRLSGTYLSETSNSFTLHRFDNYTNETATNWSGKLNTINGIVVDYLNNDLGKNNWLVYKQDDTNTNLSPYIFGGNLPTNIGDQLNFMYEAVFAQSAQNQTCNGRITTIRIPYFNADLEKVYKVWQNNAAITFVPNEYIGYRGLLYKVLQSVAGNVVPPSAPDKYEQLTYNEFQPQSVEYRVMAINLEYNPSLGFTQVVALDGGIALTNDITASLEPLSFQTAIDSLYNFIPATFLDWRQIEIELMLTSIDILTLNLNKLVRIDELNGTFYLNAISNYTPDISVPTKVILTLLP